MVKSPIDFLFLEMKDFAHEKELEEIIKGESPKNSVTGYKVWLDGRSFETCFTDSIRFEW
jgi:hypothetical protein